MGAPKITYPPPSIIWILTLLFLPQLLLRGGPPLDCATEGVPGLLAAAALGGAGGPGRPEVPPGQLAVVRVARVRLLRYACKCQNRLAAIGTKLRDVCAHHGPV